jgi:hypothetical protein
MVVARFLESTNAFIRIVAFLLNFMVCLNEKKERELYEKELVAYETRMMTDSVFIKGLYESFDAFNLNKDCLDSLKEYYQNVREK